MDHNFGDLIYCDLFFSQELSELSLCLITYKYSWEGFVCKVKLKIVCLIGVTTIYFHIVHHISVKI